MVKEELLLATRPLPSNTHSAKQRRDRLPDPWHTSEQRSTLGCNSNASLFGENRIQDVVLKRLSEKFEIVFHLDSVLSFNFSGISWRLRTNNVVSIGLEPRK